MPPARRPRTERGEPAARQHLWLVGSVVCCIARHATRTLIETKQPRREVCGSSAGPRPNGPTRRDAEGVRGGGPHGTAAIARGQESMLPRVPLRDMNAEGEVVWGEKPTPRATLRDERVWAFFLGKRTTHYVGGDRAGAGRVHEGGIVLPISKRPSTLGSISMKKHQSQHRRRSGDGVEYRSTRRCGPGAARGGCTRRVVTS